VSLAETNTGSIEVVKDHGQGLAGTTIPFRFNPTEYRTSHGHTPTKQPVPGKNETVAQATTPDATTLSLTLLFDAYESDHDLRTRYVDPLTDLLAVSTPPICQIAWGRLQFVGVIQSVDVTYTMFAPDGTPVRARADVTAIRHEPTADEDAAAATASTQVTVTAGDTLSAIAAELYGDETAWRAIAAANGLTNPRTLQTGVELLVPPPGDR
jgi:hypothetical protein